MQVSMESSVVCVLVLDQYIVLNATAAFHNMMIEMI